MFFIVKKRFLLFGKRILRLWYLRNRNFFFKILRLLDPNVFSGYSESINRKIQNNPSKEIGNTAARRVFQITSSLSTGDALSNEIINFKKILDDNYETDIYIESLKDNFPHLVQNHTDIKLRDSDIVIVQYAGYINYLENIIKHKCKKILRFHNITSHSSNKKVQVMYKLALKQLQKYKEEFDIILATSSFTKQTLVEMGYDKKSILVLPYISGSISQKECIQNSQLKEKLSQNQFNILTIGRITPHKNQLDIVKAFTNIAKQISYENKKYQYIKLFLIGNDKENTSYTKKIKSFINKNKINNQIIITGKISDSDLQTYLRNSHIIVSFSDHEGFNVPIVEGLNHKLLVIAKNNTASRETVGEAGKLVTNLEQLQEALLDVIYNYSTLHEAYLNKMKIQANKFSFNSLKRQLILTINESI